jgi:hypothetical protein
MRRKRYITPHDERRKNGPVETVRPDPLVWQAALREVDGDVTRLRTLPDGSVLVLNRERKIDFGRKC